MPRLTIDGEAINVDEGVTVLTALLQRSPVVRNSVGGEPRGPLCGMGVCFECRVTIDGVAQQKACQILAADGMRVDVVN